jgi:hypothetical protein
VREWTASAISFSPCAERVAGQTLLYSSFLALVHDELLELLLVLHGKLREVHVHILLEGAGAIHDRDLEVDCRVRDV